MTSLAKIAANKANAKKSTGPKTANGKARTRYNAVKSGIYAVHRPLPDEDHNAYEKLARRLRKRYRPSDPIEELLVDQILGHIWRVGRLEKAEKAYLQAINETRRRREDQMELRFHALLVKEKYPGQNASRYHVLAGAQVSGARPDCEGKDFDDVGRTLLEATIPKDEAKPLAYFGTERAVLLDEVLRIEENLTIRNRIIRFALPR